MSVMIYFLAENTSKHAFPPLVSRGERSLKMSSSPVTSSAPSTTTSSSNQPNVDRDKIYQWIIELSSPETREAALLELSKKREVVSDLAPMLWHSFGTMAALLQVSSN